MTVPATLAVVSGADDLAFDDLVGRKARGAFFTPPVIADYLARWAIAKNPSARVLDPTCGDGVFLLAAARRLVELGGAPERLDEQVVGVDTHAESLQRADEFLSAEGLDARLETADFFRLTPPGELFPAFEPFDAVIGNPPFVRYQHHAGEARRLSAQAALRQGVRLSGLASSWAALLVHAGSFLAPDGRLAIVLPAELLSVGYAEPVRQWLRRRFASVKLVVFERLQFVDALENVVLLLAQGSGGCDAFSLYYVLDSDELLDIQPFDEWAVALSHAGKWTELFLTNRQRQLYRRLVDDQFVPLSEFGVPELGTVTGANGYFTLNEETRVEYDLRVDEDVVATCPPGTRNLASMSLTKSDWARLRDSGERVWMFAPKGLDDHDGLQRYLELGVTRGVPEAYKCQVRANWWRPPMVTPPDLFFTYMSHRYPRLIQNSAHVTFVNSMHGIRLVDGAPRVAREALPLLALNSLTMLGAEILGRSYGGGILKMEPREAAALPLPSPKLVEAAWQVLRPDREKLDRGLREGRWTSVVARVDDALLRVAADVAPGEVAEVHEAAQALRTRRLARGSRDADV